MGYPLKIEGKLIEFPSKEDADAWLRGFLGAAPRRAAVPVEGKRAVIKPKLVYPPTRASKMVLDFLHVIAQSGSKGASSDKVFKAIGISSPNAFGNRGKNINAMLVKLGYDPILVYTNERNEQGEREWKAGPTINAAIDAVTKYGGA